MTAATVARPLPTPQAPAPCPHGPWRYVGAADAPRRGSACERPVALCCMACGFVASVDCQTTRTRQCEPCGLRYRDLVRRLAFRAEGGVLMLTLTAPGRVKHSRQLQSGKWVPCPCTSGSAGFSLGEWNAQAGAIWNRFRDHAVRRDPELAWLDHAYFKATETQQRGALHFHVLIGVAVGLVVTDEMREHLRTVAVAYGFGHHSDVQSMTARSAARYVAKYVAKGVNDRPDVPWHRVKSREVTESLPIARRAVLNGWAVHGPWLPTFVEYVSKRATFRPWSASRDWPCTMRSLREAQRHYVALTSCLPTWGDLDSPMPADVAMWLYLPDRPDLVSPSD